MKIHCEINIKTVFHEILWKKNLTVYPSLYTLLSFSSVLICYVFRFLVSRVLSKFIEKSMVRKLDVWNEKFIDYVKTYVTWSRPCTLQVELVEGEDINIAHRKYFVLNDDFEDILDTIWDSKEIGNDFEEDSESVSNTKVIYYACFLFCFWSLNLKWKKKFVKRLHLPVGLQAQLCYRATETVLKLKIDMIALF